MWTTDLAGAQLPELLGPSTMDMEAKMRNGMCVALIACSLAAFPVVANGADSTIGLGTGRSAHSQPEAWASLPLPPVPHINTMPWLTSGSLLRGPKIDILIGPAPDALGPFLVGPLRLPYQAFSDAAAHAGSARTE